MRIGKAFVFILLAGCFLLAGQPAPPHPENAAPYVLGRDDQIKIWALGVEEVTDKPSRIDPTGDIDLPFVGRIHAAGLTVAELKAKLVQEYSRQVLQPRI